MAGGSLAERRDVHQRGDAYEHVIQMQSGPFDLGTFSLDSRVATEYYCKRIARPSDSSKKVQRQVDPRALVEEYPSHEFLIDFEEAKALGFAIEEPTPQVDQLFDALRTHLLELDGYIGLVP